MPVSRYVPPKFEPWPLAQDAPCEPKPNSPPTGCELLAFVLFAGTTALGFALTSIYLSPFGDTFRPARIQQGDSFVLTYILLLLAFIYTAKRAILRRVAPSREVMWYLLMLLTSLPFMWCLVPEGCNPYVSCLLCWIGFPILFWSIPTVTFIGDRLNPEPLPTGVYLVRSGLEVVFVFPFWCLICATYFESFGGTRVRWIFWY